MKQLLFSLLFLVLMRTLASAQCIGDSIYHYVNNNQLLAKQIHKVFKIKQRKNLDILLDTARVDSDFGVFEDSLLKKNYPKHYLDSTKNALYKNADSLASYPKFCNVNSSFVNDSNYRESKVNLVLFVGRSHSHFVVCKIKNCTDEYYGHSNSQPETIYLLFILNNSNEIISVINRSGKEWMEPTIFY